MDINALRVFNALYRLGITDEEFKEIEEEQSHTERTGLSVNLIKKGNIVGVSHDESHKIIIQRADGDIKAKPKSRVLFKTLITFEVPQEIYTLHSIAQYRALDSDIRYVANDIGELKDRVCDRFIDEYPKELGEMYQDVYGDEDGRKKNRRLKAEMVERQMRALFWLFGEDFRSFKPTPSRLNIARIVKVFSRNNRRLAIIQTNERWDKKRGRFFQPRWVELMERTTFKIATFTPRDAQYNYVSPNREMYLGDCDDEPSIWLADDLFEKVTAEELKVLSRRLDGGWVLLDADGYNRQKSGIRVELMTAKRREQEAEAKSKLVEAIGREFRKGKVVRHGITFTPTSVSYEGVALEGNKLGEYLSNQRIILQERPNFNDIFEGYVEFILDLEAVHSTWDCSSRIECRFDGREVIRIGNISLAIEKRGNNIFVNGSRICREDVSAVVKKAATYLEQKEYDEWVRQTSRANLVLQEALKLGALSFELKVDRTADNCLMGKGDGKMLLSLPIVRREGRNYVRIGGREFKVKSTKALFDLGKGIDSCRIGQSGGGYLQRTIKLLYKAIDEITPKEIGELIKDGKSEYRKMVRKLDAEREEKLARSRDFVANAVRLTKARKVDGGYFVKGLSGVLYFVDEDLGVWMVKDGKQRQYLCIVDDDVGDRDDEALRNDRVAKRLLMLAKDRKVAREVYDNGDRMDTHWRDIQEPMGEVV